ncbi:MAG: GFA family protein [Polyangiaceae bacterium]|nr:GFA family protein [Polyangiaceae bacterium]
MQTFTGGCHCGKVRYEVKADLSKGVMACNCSMCSRMGWLLIFVPRESFTLLSGENALTDYQFNKKQIHHVFCSTCGIRSFAHGKGPGGTETVAINVRCVDGLDPSSLAVKQVDGKSL